MSNFDSSPNLSLPFLLASQAQKHVTFNDAIVSIDNLLMLAVKSRSIPAQPPAPIEGDRYIIEYASSGEWAEKIGQIAAYNNLGWAFYPPKAGFICYVADENAVIFFDGTAWNNLSLSATDFQNLAFLGIGTNADDENPFALKANNVLFSAKYAAENGNGDIRIKLNKENYSKNASFIFQDNWSGRAEFGLCGNDDFSIKVSPDGMNWSEAFCINSTNGKLKPFDISENPLPDARPLFTSSTTTRLIASDGNTARFIMETFSAGSIIGGRASRGTCAAPAPSVLNQTFFQIVGLGQKPSGSSTLASANMFIRATQDWTDSANGTEIGFGTTPNGTTTKANVLLIGSDGALKPYVDNAYPLGDPSLRFSTIYCATGAINTSDARDKIEQSEISGETALHLVKSIEPKIFKWKVGKRVADLNAYVPNDNDENPQPDYNDIIGMRNHAGFFAQDIKAALDDLGLDLGVWGLDDKNDPNSKQWLRPDQMIPILWAAVRGLQEQINKTIT